MSDKMNNHLDGIDEERRAAVLRLVCGAAFVVPVVASFTLDSTLSIATAGNYASVS